MPVMTGCWEIDELALEGYYEQFGGAVPPSAKLYKIWEKIVCCPPVNGSGSMRCRSNVAPSARSYKEAVPSSRERSSKGASSRPETESSSLGRHSTVGGGQ